MENTLPRSHPFDYALAMASLVRYAAPRDRLRRLCRAGEVRRVRKGLYVRLVDGVSGVDPLVHSGLVYGPSYVSRETALALHGMIPERVEEVTCMTTGRDKVFATPEGRFAYRLMPRAAFALGIGLAEAPGGTYFLAGPEKALCDRIAQLRGLADPSEVGSWLEDDLRVNPGGLDGLDAALVARIAAAYGRRNVRALARWLERGRR